MAIVLDHTIVPAKDKVASAEFFADIFGLKVKPGQGHFAQVQINDSLTFDFADEPEAWGGPGFDPRTGKSHHYAFHTSEAEFEAICGRVVTPRPAKTIPIPSNPARGSSKRSSAGGKPRGPPSAGGHTTTPTARF